MCAASMDDPMKILPGEEQQNHLLNMLFEQTEIGVFFMMLDEPVEWNDSIDKEQALDYTFDHQRITKINQHMLDQYGAKPEIFIGATPNQLFEYDLQQGRAVWRKFFDQGILSYDTFEQKLDGTPIQVRGTYLCFYDKAGRITGHFGIQSEVSASRAAKEKEERLLRALNEKNMLVDTILDHAPFGIWSSGTSPGSIFTNRYFKDHFAMTPEEEATCMASDRDAMAEDTPQQYEEAVTFQDGKKHTLHVIKARIGEKGHPETTMFGYGFDITDRKRAEQELLYLSTHDSHTGLLNRNALIKRYSEATNKEKSTAVIFLDIDNFRMVNDTLGHKAGDQIIAEFAYILKNLVADNGDVYRHEGDEFIVVLESSDLNEVRELADDLKTNLARRIAISNRSYSLSVSIGVCLPQECNSLEHAVKKADTALYLSKRKNNGITFYLPWMEEQRTREATLEADMFHGLEREEFSVLYQPIRNLETGTIRHVEALLRWNHPVFGPVSPEEFIALAEKTRFIIPLTEWLLRQACSTIATWQSLGLIDLAIAVNVSFVHFENKSDELLLLLCNYIQEYGIKPSRLSLEITESTLMHDPENTIKVLQTIRDLGVGLALDDFGTGYSSLSNLINLPVHVVKIDRSLIRNISTNPKEQSLARAIIGVCQDINAKVVAEGVETEEQVELLRRFGCDYIQGYVISRPMDAEQLPNWIKCNPCRA